ncbi:FAD binding domain protein [Cellvibrio japonicus Ueda107]|uniref:FAD binding domain protein n=2 Tax=Cellvibrio japonicus TaxID=155077 RepID=B3PGH1_CELJU|nr:FAD binding domain protein [Cellvibrio japonicus Ueda107]
MRAHINMQQHPLTPFGTAPVRVAIVGAGPAGSATAIALCNALAEQKRDDIEVCIFHRTTAKRWPLGETIPPAASAVLRELQLPGLLHSGRHLPCPGSLSVWGGEKAQANDFLLDLSGSGYHLDREDFDSGLLHEAQKRGTKVHSDYSLRHLLSKPLSDEGGFTLMFATPEGEQQLDADFVVDASGQGAAVMRRLDIARNQLDEVISLYTRIALADHNTLPQHTLLEATADGWWYLSAVPGGDCVLSLTTDAQQLKAKNLDKPDQWQHAYTQAKWLNQFLSAQQLNHYPLRQAPARSAILSNCVGSHWLAVGDAACSFDSISSAGITNALIQGLWAGQALAAYFIDVNRTALAAYQDKVFARFNQYVGVRSYLYAQETRFPTEGFWQRRRLG